MLMRHILMPTLHTIKQTPQHNTVSLPVHMLTQHTFTPIRHSVHRTQLVLMLTLPTHRQTPQHNTVSLLVLTPMQPMLKRTPQHNTVSLPVHMLMPHTIKQTPQHNTVQVLVHMLMHPMYMQIVDTLTQMLVLTKPILPFNMVSLLVLMLMPLMQLQTQVIHIVNLYMFTQQL